MTKHCVIEDKGSTLKCLNCGKSQAVELPMELQEYANLTLAFVRLHKPCKAGAPALTVEVKSA
jgi:hypothetical protein